MPADPTSSASRFLRLARQGKHPGSSSGEKKCARLARFLANDLDAFTGLDEDSIEGFIALLRAANRGEFCSVQETLEVSGFAQN